MSESVTERTVIAASPSTILDAIIAVDAYPQWQRDVKEVEVLERDAQGRPARARFVVDARIFTATYVLRYSYGEGTVRWKLESSDQLRALDGGYTVTDAGDGQSTVVYELIADPTISIPRFMRRAAAEKIVRSALDNLRDRVEPGR
ncbi:MAG: SRPBCC family protein [Actinobacteria bacterium]|nr:SRPBCC family protein [Actinomycetota bacterium]